VNFPSVSKMTVVFIPSQSAHGKTPSYVPFQSRELYELCSSAKRGPSLGLKTTSPSSLLETIIIKKGLEVKLCSSHFNTLKLNESCPSTFSKLTGTISVLISVSF